MEVRDALKLRVKLERLTFYEQLRYAVTISRRTDTRLLSAAGTIEAQMPYDGEKYFDKAALARVVNAKEHAAVQDALIGYVGLSRYDRTSFTEYAPDEELHPIKIPVKIQIADVNELIATGSKCISSIGYNIAEPANLPVMVDAVLTDDLETEDWQKTSTSFQEQLRLKLSVRSDVGNISKVVRDKILEKVSDNREEAQKALRAVQEEISQAGEKPTEALLVKRAEVTDRLHRLTAIQSDLEELASKPVEQFTAEGVIAVIKHAVEEDKERLSQATRDELNRLTQFVRSNLGGAQIAYLGLEWPYSEQMVSTMASRRGSHWCYNPESKRMEIRNVGMRWNSTTRLYEATLYLNLYRPVEQFPSVRGDLVLQIDKLLSGLEAKWLDVRGRGRADVTIEHKTSIAVEIEKINLIDVFHRRTFSPRRHFHFKSVLPNLNRLRDVENVLNDLGLTILKTSYASEPAKVDFTQGCWIAATKRGISEHLRIWVHMSGTTTTGSHTITYDDGRQKLDENVPLGDTEIDLFARMIGDSSSIALILNDIQTHLERRFASARLV